MFDDLNSLQNLAKLDVVLTGDWTLSPSEQPEWNGEAIGETAIVGIIFLSCGNRTYWAKSGQPHVKIVPQGYYESRPISNKLSLELRLYPIPNFNVRFMYSVGLGYGISNATAMLSSGDFMPQIPHSSTVQTGQLFTFVRFNSTPIATLYAMFLAKQDVKMHRKHIWGLRTPLVANLTSPLLDIFAFSRSGELAV